MWTWSSNWISEGEGPLSLLAKFQAANVLTPAECCQHLFHRDLKPSVSASRSLLNISWRAPTANDSIACLIASRSLSEICGRWTSWIADDSVTRICLCCLDQGFLPSCLQLCGIRRCPIHDAELIENCPSCGAGTGTYAISSSTFSQPFICRKCNNPFSEKWERLKNRLDWRPQTLSPKLREMDAWLLSAKSYDIEWARIDNWQITADTMPRSRMHAAAVLGALTKLIPGTPCRDVPAPHVTLCSVVSQKKFEADEENIAERISLYVDLRGQLRDWSEQKAGGLTHTYSDALHGYRNMRTPLSCDYSPIWHAFHIWRARFETIRPIDALDFIDIGIHPNTKAFVWPDFCEINLNAWLNFMLSCWIVDLRTAHGWHSVLESAKNLPLRKREATLMQYYSNASLFLCPQLSPYPPAITTIIVRDKAGKQILLMIW